MAEDVASPDLPEVGSDRGRRVRDAVEAALSDIILLGTPEQVRLAAQAAHDMVAGRNVETAALVVSLRTFIREVLDLDAVPNDIAVPKQGPQRPAGASARAGRGDRAGSSDTGRGSGQRGAGTGGEAGSPAALDDGASAADASAHR
jgi:hypothetical protein